MTAYPTTIATDLDLQRIDNNLTELGGGSINSLIDEVIAIETALGNPIGVCGNLENRLSVSIGDDGYIKPAAISSIGLISLPILSTMFLDSTIPETKLVLDYSTASLYAALQSALTSISVTNSAFATLDLKFYQHVFGFAYDDGYTGRHVASHIDINDGYENGYQRYVGIDFRDLSFYNSGLIDLSGYIRPAKTVMDALIQINSDFVLHALSLDGYHNASFVNVDTTNFVMIPSAYNTVQKAIEYLDNFEGNVVDEHRFVQHSNGIPNYSKVFGYATADGYNNYFGPFNCSTVIDTSTKLSYVDFASVADKTLDWAFAQTAVGDKIRINYGGFLSTFSVENIEYVPQTTFRVYIDGYHPVETTLASAILEKSNYDDNHYGELAVCLSDHNYYYVNGLSNAQVPGSAIVIKPNAASVLGMEVALDQLNSTHYNLYIGFYPTGNPSQLAIQFPQIAAIDVTGNLGKTPGQYTLKQIVNNINKQFRSGGYNFRLVCFEYKGCLGLAIPEVIDNAGFSIISGVGTLGSISQSTFINNVVDVNDTSFDPFGFGSLKANIASPKYTGTSDTYIPTQVFLPKIGKKYSINGQFTDVLAPGFDTEYGSYYNAMFVERRLDSSNKRYIGVYKVEKTLEDSKLQPGSTIVVNPTLAITDSKYNNNDYGRFIVEKIDHFCGDGYTYIEVINCVSLYGNALLSATNPGTRTGDPANWLPVKLYYSDDSISLSPTVPNGIVDYKRYFEFYIKKDGKTFAHERARMPLQSPVGSLLDTTIGTSFTTPPTNPSGALNSGWHIVDVSPKLKGFFAVGSSDQKKYIRFVVKNYSSVDESYDGFICQKDGGSSLTINVGPTIRVSKGDVGRYYDNTGIDYIDIKFDKSFIDSDNLQYENTLPMSPLTSYYVDIEIFGTLRTNEEYMCLGSCEQLTATNNRSSVWNFNDLRQFGTLSEKDLTTSAINFIESGDKWLHNNGVINGFNFATSGSDFFNFTGGSAIINGKIINKNDFTIHPYNILENGGATTQTINFAICITDTGASELVIIDDTSNIVKYKYDSLVTGGYAYCKVYNLSQLIRVRKDLLPIYIISVDCSDTGLYTISLDPFDIRKFVKNTDSKNDLVLCGGVNFEQDISYDELGHFTSWDSLANYVKYFKDSQTTVLVRGTTYINNTIDFADNPVTLIGDKSNIIYVNDLVDIGINISSNMDLIGLNFVSKYNVISTAVSYTRSKATVGCSLSDGNYIAKNINIKNCSFSHYTGCRAAGISHILFEQIGDGGLFENITIENNTFLESKTQLCIAFTNIDGLAATVDNFATAIGTIANSITISNNKGNFGSWILLSSDNHSTGNGKNSRGLSGYNVKIINNSFDHIFYHLSKSVSNSFNGLILENSNVNYPSLNSGVFISKNTCVSIQNKVIELSTVNLNGFGTYVDVGINSFATKIASAPTSICDNICSNIHVSVDGDIETGSYPISYNKITHSYVYSNIDYPRSLSQVNISNNILSSSIYDPTLFAGNLEADEITVYPTVYTSPAILVGGNVGSSGVRENVCTISGNIIKYGVDYKGNSVDGYQYNNAIVTTIPCTIENNRISKCFKYSGIWLNYDITTGFTTDGYDIISKVSNNTIERGLADVLAFIYISGGAYINKLVITDNIFDKGYNDNEETDIYTIKYNFNYAYKLLLQRNVNHHFIVNGFEFVKCESIDYSDVSNLSTAFIWNVSTLVNPTTGLVYPSVKTYAFAATGSKDFTKMLYFTLPVLDGAVPVSMSFYVQANDTATSPDRDYKLFAYSQTVGGINRSFYAYNAGATEWLPSDYTISPSTATRDASLTLHTIYFGVQFLNKYNGMSSTDRSTTIALAVGNTDQSFYQYNVGDYINIWGINVLYRY